jgi:hypothetical protein
MTRMVTRVAVTVAIVLAIVITAKMFMLFGPFIEEVFSAASKACWDVRPLCY